MVIIIKDEEQPGVPSKWQSLVLLRHYRETLSCGMRSRGRKQSASNANGSGLPAMNEGAEKRNITVTIEGVSTASREETLIRKALKEP